MKKRRALLLPLLALLLVVGIPAGLLLREYRYEQASQALIAAIKVNDTEKALAALRAGADANAKDFGKPASFASQLKYIFDRLLHRDTGVSREVHPTALIVLLGLHYDDTGGFSTPVENVTILEALLKRGADVNVQDVSGTTPLLYACLNQFSESARMLVEHKADVNARNHLRTAPLIWGTGNPEIVKNLLLHHAEVNAKDGFGETALDHAIDRNDNEDILLLKKAGAKTGQELDAEAKH